MRINENNYVDKAEKVIDKLRRKQLRNGKPDPMVTTSKLRNLLATTADIYNEVITCQTEKLGKDTVARIEYLRVRFIYESGREGKVRELVEEAEILDILKEIGGNRTNYILFNHYMEALVAFHKFYGGRDN